MVAHVWLFSIGSSNFARSLRGNFRQLEFAKPIKFAKTPLLNDSHARATCICRWEQKHVPGSSHNSSHTHCWSWKLRCARGVHASRMQHPAIMLVSLNLNPPIQIANGTSYH